MSIYNNSMVNGSIFRGMQRQFIFYTISKFSHDVTDEIDEMYTYL